MGAAAVTDTRERVVRDEHGTATIARRLASGLVPGDVVYVTGPIGAGKTTFIRHACCALGVSEPVTSPTFATAHAYQGSDGLRVSHLDCFRAAPVAIDAAADLEAYLDEDGVVFIEWPPTGAALIPAATVTVTLRLDATGDRRIRILRTMP